MTTHNIQEQDLRTALNDARQWVEHAVAPLRPLSPEAAKPGEDLLTRIDAALLAAPPRPVDAERVEDEAGFLHTAQTSLSWRDTAMQFSRNEDFYRGIVVQISEMFGDAAKTSNDGSVQQDVLALRVPELVAALLASPAHSPDKAVTREGVDAAFTDRIHGRTVLQVADLVEERVARGDVPGANFPSDWLPFLVRGLRAALATKATGTEAGRSVGAEITHDMLVAFYKAAWPAAWDANGAVSDHKLDDLKRGFAAAYAATPTPPVSPTPSDETGRKTADVGVFGPIDGMGYRDLSGSYIGLSVSGKHFAHGFRISIGAAEVLAAELAGLLDKPVSSSPDSTGPAEYRDEEHRWWWENHPKIAKLRDAETAARRPSLEREAAISRATSPIFGDMAQTAYPEPDSTGPAEDDDDKTTERAMMRIEAEADAWISETPDIGKMVKMIAHGWPSHLKDRAAAQADALVRQTFVEAFYRGFNAHRDHAAAIAALTPSAPIAAGAVDLRSMLANLAQLAADEGRKQDAEVLLSASAALATSPQSVEASK